MAYTGIIAQILLSSPSDLPTEHHDVITRAVRRWNTQHGRIYGIQFSPTDWSEGGSPAFGEYAQSVLNEQIVDDSDLGLVVFTDRLGTPTPDHKSGTVEEVSRLLDHGKDVAVLINDCQRPTNRGTRFIEQRQALDEYIDSIKSKAFFSHYDSTSRLAEIVDSVLTRLATKYKREADASRTTGPDTAATQQTAAPDPTLSELKTEIEGGIWPRIEVNESVKTDSKGRVRTSKNWQLVLESTLPYAAHNVRYSYVDSDGNPDATFDAIGSSRPQEPLSILRPMGSESYPLYLTFGSSPQTNCIVQWEDQEGQTRSTESTVRTH